MTSPQRSLVGGRWFTVLVLMTIYISSYFDRQVIVILVPFIERDLHVSDFAISLLIGPLFALLYTTLGVLAGWIGDRWSRVKLIFLGSFAWSLATLASGVASSFAQLSGARIAVGVGEATLTPAAHAIIANRFPRERLALPLSVYNLGQAIGSGIALALGGYIVHTIAHEPMKSLPIVGRVYAWQLVFIYTALLSLIISPISLLLRDSAGITSHSEAARTSDGPAIALAPFMWRHRAIFIPLILAFGFGLIGNYAVISWVPTYAGRAFGLNAAEVGFLWGGIFFATSLIGQLISGTVVDRMVRRGILNAHLIYYATTITLVAPIFFLCSLSKNLTIYLIGAGLYCLIFYPFFAYAAAALQSITPNHLRAQVSGVLLAVTSMIGLGLGPTSVAAISDYVFADRTKLGVALGIVVLTILPLIWVCIRIANKPFKKAMRAAVGGRV